MMELTDEQVLTAMLAWWRKAILPQEIRTEEALAANPVGPTPTAAEELRTCLPKEAVAEIQAAVAVRAGGSEDGVEGERMRWRT